MARTVLIADPATVELQPAPIREEWVLKGNPVARGTKLAASNDRLSSILVWDCSPGTFRWHYGKEETVYVLSGEAIMTSETGEIRRMSAGEVGFFPAGYQCTWQVTQHFRKIAIVRDGLWLPLGLALKAWLRLLSLLGISGKGGL